MITSITNPAKSITTASLELEAIGESLWAVRRVGSSELVAEMGFTDFKSQGPAATLVIGNSVQGSMAWIAEGIRVVLDYALDEFKLGKVSARVSVEQLSLLAALEDFGFVEKSRSEGGKKIRLVADRWDYLRALAETEMLERLDDREWSFGFDSGRRRAGMCSYNDKKITVSKYLVLVHSVDDVMQTVLHEIAHALCGPKEGHSKKWLATAKKLGYRNDKYTGQEIAATYAPYKGLCPNGHEHFRYRKPSRLYSCQHCSNGYNSRYMIDWMARAS
jgi:RimJ/RimL family protein N-acetyltransferase